MLCNTDKSGMKGLAACTESSQNNTEDCTAVAGLAENVDQLDVVIYLNKYLMKSRNTI